MAIYGMPSEMRIGEAFSVIYSS